jgi:glycerol-3-phosphate dehydrogenase
VSEERDLLVIGGGLVGAAVFRNACGLGLRTLLLEQGPLGGAGTEASTGILFNGLRRFPLDLAQAAARAGETAHLLARWKPLMRRQSFLWPRYRCDGPAPLMHVGTHALLSPKEAMKEEGGLCPKGLLCALRFEEWSLDAALLARSLIQEGIALGGQALAGTKVLALTGLQGPAADVRCTNLDGASLNFKAKVVLNATGAWAAETAVLAGCRKPDVPLLRETYLILSGKPARNALIIGGRDPIVLVPKGEESWAGPLDDAARLRSALRAILPALPMEGSPRTLSAARPALRGWRVFEHSKEGARNLVSVVCGDIALCRPASEAALNAALKRLGRPPSFEPAPERRPALESLLRAGGRPLRAGFWAFHRLRAFARLRKYSKTCS